MKILKTAKDHQQALKLLEELMRSDPPDDSPKSDEIELLAFLIETYEKANIPIPPPDPIDAIRFRMDQMGLAQQDLVPYIGSKSRVSEVLSGKRPLTLSMIRELHRGLGIPMEILANQPEEEIPNQIDVEAYPVREMYSHGYFGHVIEKWTKALNDRREELLHSFFKGREREPIGALNRQSPRAKSQIHVEALHAWRCRVMDRAMEKQLTRYNYDELTDQFIKSLTALTQFPQGPQLVIQALEDRGIAVVLEPHLDKTHLDGAALLLPDGRPVIGLTLRYNRLDNFWFTLFHELGHVKLHLKSGEQNGFIDTDIDKTSEQHVEREADRFALNSFIPEEDWKILQGLHYADDIRKAAKARSIDPSILAGRLRREAQDYRAHRTLIGQGMVKKTLGIG